MSESAGGGAPPRDTQALRWASVTAAGAVLARAGRLYYARLAATGASSVRLHDGSGVSGPLLLGLATAAAGADDWPRVPVSLPFLHGVYVELTGTAVLTLGWDTD